MTSTREGNTKHSQVNIINTFYLSLYWFCNSFKCLTLVLHGTHNLIIIHLVSLLKYCINNNNTVTIIIIIMSSQETITKVMGFSIKHTLKEVLLKQQEVLYCTSLPLTDIFSQKFSDK